MKSLILSMLCGTSAFCTQRIELESTLRAICTLQFSKRCSSVLCNFRNGALLYFAIFETVFFCTLQFSTSAILYFAKFEPVQFQSNFNAIRLIFVQFQCNSCNFNRIPIQFQSNFSAILENGCNSNQISMQFSNKGCNFN